MFSEQFISVWQVCVKLASDQAWGPLIQFIQRNRLLWNTDHQSRRHLVSGFRHAEFCIKNVQLYNRMMTMNPGTSSITRCGELGDLHDHTLTHVFFLIQMINAQFPIKRATNTWNIKIRLRSGEQNLDSCFVKRRDAALQDERLFRQLHNIWSAIKKDHQGFLSKEVHEIIFLRFFEVFAFDVNDSQQRAELVAKDWAIRADGRVAIDGERFMATMAATCDAWCETPSVDEMIEFSEYFLSLIMDVQARSAAMTLGDGRDVRQKGNRSVVANAVLLSLGKKNLSLDPLRRQTFEKKTGGILLPVQPKDEVAGLDESFSKFSNSCCVSGGGGDNEAGADDIFGEDRLHVLELLDRIGANDDVPDGDEEGDTNALVWNNSERRLSQAMFRRRSSRRGSSRLADERRGSAAFGPLAAAVVIGTDGVDESVPAASEHPASFATKSLVSFVIALARGHVPHFTPRPIREPIVSTTIEPLGSEIPLADLAKPGPAVSVAPAKRAASGRRGADALVVPPTFARSGALSRFQKGQSSVSSGKEDGEVSDDSVDEAVALAEACVRASPSPGPFERPSRSSIELAPPQLLTIPGESGSAGRKSRTRSVVLPSTTFAEGWASFQDIVDTDATSAAFRPSASVMGGSVLDGTRRSNSTTLDEGGGQDDVTLRRRSSVRRALSMSNKWDFVAAMKHVASDRSMSRQEESAVAALALREEEIFFAYHPLDVLKCPIGLARALSRVRGQMYTSSNDIYGDWFAPRCFGKISVVSLREKRHQMNIGLFELDSTGSSTGGRRMKTLPFQWFADERVTRVGVTSSVASEDASGWLPLPANASQFLSQQWFEGFDGILELTQCVVVDPGSYFSDGGDPDMETSIPISLSGTANSNSCSRLTAPSTSTSGLSKLQYVDMLTLRLSTSIPVEVGGRRTVVDGHRLCAKYDHLWEFSNKTNTMWAAFSLELQDKLRNWLQQVKEYDKAQFARLTAATHVPGYTPAASLRRSIVSSLRSRSTQITRDPTYDFNFDEVIAAMSKFTSHTISLCHPRMTLTSWCGSISRVVPIRYSTIFINEDHNVQAVRITDDWIPTPVVRKELYESAKHGSLPQPTSVVNAPRVVEPFQRTPLVPLDVLEYARNGTTPFTEVDSLDPCLPFVGGGGAVTLLPTAALAHATFSNPTFGTKDDFDVDDDETLPQCITSSAEVVADVAEEPEPLLDIHNLPPHSIRSLHATKAELAVLREEAARPGLLEDLWRKTDGIVDGQSQHDAGRGHPPRAQTNLRPGSSGYFRGKVLHAKQNGRVGGGMATAPPKSKFSLANVGQEGLKAIDENKSDAKLLAPHNTTTVTSRPLSPARRPESAALRFAARWHALHDQPAPQEVSKLHLMQTQASLSSVVNNSSAVLPQQLRGAVHRPNSSLSRTLPNQVAQSAHGRVLVRHVPANNSVVM